MARQDTDTVDDIKPALAASKYFVHSISNLDFEFGAATHTGLRRNENQDHYVVLRRTRTQQLLFTNVSTSQLSLPTDETYGMAVADGMGGTGLGGLASELAIRTVWELAGRTTSWIMKVQDLNSPELSERIEGFSYLMQQAFIEEFHDNPQFGESGTTWTAAYFVSSFAVVAQIGDSPAFLWRDGTMRRICTDHTVAQEFIANGVAPQIAAKFSHMLTRCLGYGSQNCRPEVHFLRIRPGDQLLLCTDGLTDMVDESHIAERLDRAKDAQSACDGLISLALTAGGKDNVTAVLARAKPL
ncbi:MAG TPA: protein phosphatase 2C domain-containing protein [Lacipirellulaceae bacterium]|nr:protein phosphatase 2C domain-containing protein [Lacipirellulaceae bacterium]